MNLLRQGVEPCSHILRILVQQLTGLISRESRRFLRSLLQIKLRAEPLLIPYIYLFLHFLLLNQTVLQLRFQPFLLIRKPDKLLSVLQILFILLLKPLHIPKLSLQPCNLFFQPAPVCFPLLSALPQLILPHAQGANLLLQPARFFPRVLQALSGPRISFFRQILEPEYIIFLRQQIPLPSACQNGFVRFHQPLLLSFQQLRKPLLIQQLPVEQHIEAYLSQSDERLFSRSSRRLQILPSDYGNRKFRIDRQIRRSQGGNIPFRKDNAVRQERIAQGNSLLLLRVLIQPLQPFHSVYVMNPRALQRILKLLRKLKHSSGAQLLIFLRERLSPLLPFPERYFQLSKLPLISLEQIRRIKQSVIPAVHIPQQGSADLHSLIQPVHRLFALQNPPLTGACSPAAVLQLSRAPAQQILPFLALLLQSG